MKTEPKQNYKFIYNAFVRASETAVHLLQKAKDFSVEKGIPEEAILDARLAPDMFNFVKQIQVFTDNVAGGIARGAGLMKPSLPDTETNIEQLIQRVIKVQDFLATVDPEKVEGFEKLQIKLPWMGEGMYFDAETYLGNFVIQNTLFHLTIAYAILRHLGVQVGKQDFMGQLEMKSSV